MWIICGILTAFNYLPPGHPARTDAKIEIVRSAAWIRVPYPGTWRTKYRYSLSLI